MNNKLLVTIEDGSQAEINVLDIISENPFNKEFIIYTVNGNNNVVFASILNETDSSYSLDTIESPKELDYINDEITRVTSLMQSGE